MKINIFGVGRSGTKAVQLYLSYLIAKKEGKVLINYEPYYWKNRRTLNLNYEGIYHHVNSSLIIDSKSQLTDNHIGYLLKLIDCSESVVTKFIRANGRIGAINQITRPNFTVVIIRDLYKILRSLSKFEWDLLGSGLVYNNDWNRLVLEVREKEIITHNDLDYYLKHISDARDKNAFYWYIMNKLALDYEGINTFYIDYDNISLIEEIAYKNGLLVNNYDIDNKIFKGSNLHKDYPLIEINESNKFSYSLFGSLNKLNLNKCFDDVNNSKDSYIEDIKSNELYDFFVKDIKEKIKLKKDFLLENNNRKYGNSLSIKSIKKDKKKIEDKVEKIFNMNSYNMKYKYFISQELINYLLHCNKEKIFILGTNIRAKRVYEFITEINEVFNKKIEVKSFIEFDEKKSENFGYKKNVIGLDKENIKNIDRIIVTSVWEKEFFNQFLNFNIKPQKLIFSNDIYTITHWDNIDITEKERISYLEKSNIWAPIISKDLYCFIDKNQESEVIIFGAGKKGIEVFELIENTNRYLNKKIKVTAFMDNDCNKWGKEILGREINEPQFDKIEKVDKVIVASMWVEEITHQLLKMGIKREQIVCAI
jgi:hypothetical protein